MKYHSINKRSPAVDFREATIRGLAPDKGLYFPEIIPRVRKQLIEEIGQVDYPDIAMEVIRPYVAGTIPNDELQRIVADTIDFSMPLIKITDEIYSLELFHGPTLAFKDIGARFMSRCLGYFMRNEKREVTVLVATSGDTGGAVANGFHGVEGVNVVILYPLGKVSPVQEQQLTTVGDNIHALEVLGTFDDCQRMVKTAFADMTINRHLFLTSANSINVARWLPQQFYYFFAFKKWDNKFQPPVISVPSGNFGNICAGMLAQASGLPVDHFIAACNINDVVSDYLTSGVYHPRSSVATISNAMDVGDPSNFIRILEIVNRLNAESPLNELKKNMSVYRVTDQETEDIIKKYFTDHHYLADPHGAVALSALEQELKKYPQQKGIFLETAHPVKFLAHVEKAIGKQIELPPSINQLMLQKKHATQISPVYKELKNYLLRS